MGKTKIQWSQETWNPVVGCKRVSSGCDHCYAFQLHDQRHIAWKRGRWDSAPAQYHMPFSTVQLLPERLSDPLRWRKPRRVFVNSMSDLFHEDVPDEFIDRVFGVMARATQHTFQILTKRPQRMRDYMARWQPSGYRINGNSYECVTLSTPETDGTLLGPLTNVWLGVSVENQQAADERIPLLLETPAAVRFLSCEPLLGPIGRLYRRPGYLYTADYRPSDDALKQGIHWVIIGGESGPHARPMELAWVESLLAQCWGAGVAPFVKQLGTVWAKATHASDSHGGVMADWPEHLRVREYPQTGGAVVIARQRPPKIPNENQEVDDASL